MQKNSKFNKSQNSATTATNFNLHSGLLPPQSIEFERTVVGTYLIDKKALVLAPHGIEPSLYYDPRHVEIIKAIITLQKKNAPIDILTVVQQLKSTKRLQLAGGDSYVINLTMGVSSSAHIEYHIAQIAEKAILRRMLELSQQIQSHIYDGSDVFKIRDEIFVKEFDSLFVENSFSRQKTIKDYVAEQVQEIKNIQEGILNGVPIEQEELRKVLGSFRNSFVYLFAGRPGMGKNVIANQLVVSNKKMGKKTGMLSLEMAGLELINRLSSNEMQIDNYYFTRKKMNEQQLEYYFQNISKVEEYDDYFFIDDSPAVDINQLRSKAIQMKHKYDIDMLILDYVQLVEGDRSLGTEEAKLSAISRETKKIAKLLNIPVIEISQLNRDVEYKPGHKRPELSSLKGSGALEADADVVVLLYRPEYYGIEFWDDIDDGKELQNPTAGQIEFNIAKHRGGGLKKPRFGIDLAKNSFYDIQQVHY